MTFPKPITLADLTDIACRVTGLPLVIEAHPEHGELFAWVEPHEMGALTEEVRLTLRQELESSVTFQVIVGAGIIIWTGLVHDPEDDEAELMSI
jgi:hypothetical protein